MLEVLEDRALPSTYTVTDLGDAGSGSGLQGDLRYAVNMANSNNDLSNHIEFAPGLAGTITLTQGSLAITKNLEIDGPSQDVITVSGNNQSGVFDITNDPKVQDVRLLDLTITGGTGIQFSQHREGGGIYNDHATMTLTRVSVSGNVLPDQGLGGGIYNQSGAVTLESSTVSGNQVGFQGDGAGIYNASGTFTIDNSTLANNIGISIFTPSAISNGSDKNVVALSDSAILNNVGTGISRGDVTVDHSTVSGNGVAGISVSRATVDHSTIAGNAYGGIFTSTYLALTDSMVMGNRVASGVSTGGYATITRSTISGNQAYNAGGGFSSAGTGSFALITDSTISENTAGGGGGIVVGSKDSTIEVISSTIVGNSATGIHPYYEGGGGIGFYLGGGSQGTLVLLNTIVAGNTSATTGPDVDGAAISLGYNFIGMADDSSGWGSHDRTGTSTEPLDPKLGPLQDNGGPTLTHAPLFGSPVTFGGDIGLTGPDQRGSTRNGSVGAVTASLAVGLRVIAPDTVMPGEPFDITVIAIDAWGNTASTYHDTLHFSSNDLGAQLPEDYTFADTDGGAHTFVASLATPGQQTIAISDLNNGAIHFDLSVFVDGGMDLLSVPANLTTSGIRQRR
jgi:hypothetical protein